MADTNLLLLAREFKKLRTNVTEVLQMPVGPQGLQGDKGEKGDIGSVGPAGRDGKDGKDGSKGFDGTNGKDGTNGVDGLDGKDGISVVDARVDFDGSLVLTLSNGTEIDAGKVSSEQVENVYAMLKNGAASLNELLPSQEGNTNKYLKTDGTNTSWDTLDGSDINLSSPPIIGDVAPNAGTFTTLTATGQTSLGGALDQESLRVLTPSATSFGYLSVQGISASVTQLKGNTKGSTGSIAFTAVGASGVLSFTTGNSTSPQLQVTHTTSAVNYVQVTGAATTAIPAITVQGSDTNISAYLSSKGNGSVRIATNNTSNTQFRVTNTASSVNFLNATGSVANSAPILSVDGNDTNIDLALTPKGTGNVRFGTRTASADAAITGYIEIKDSGGTVRRLAVIG